MRSWNSIWETSIRGLILEQSGKMPSAVKEMLEQMRNWNSICDAVPEDNLGAKRKDVLCHTSTA